MGIGKSNGEKKVEEAVRQAIENPLTENKIDGAKGVIDYSEDFLKIDLGNICLKISGNKRVIESFVYEHIDVKGEIITVEFMN